MAMKMDVCAYCGEYAQTECEHVVPQSFAPEELLASCAWVCVRACARCNRSFSAVESDFRGYATLINAPGETLVKDALFEGPVRRNWERKEGRGSFVRMLRMIRKSDGAPLSNVNELLTEKNLGIEPDARVMRAARKFIRGLYFHHFTQKRGFPQVVPESQITVWPSWGWSAEDIQWMYDLPGLRVIHPAVFVYVFAECEEAQVAIPGIDSFWLLYACKGPIFTGIVRANTFPLVAAWA